MSELDRSNAYKPSVEQMRRRELVLQVTNTFEKEQFRYAIVGGYGLDGLLGTLTRDHGDIDLLVENTDVAAKLLAKFGFQRGETKESGVEVLIHPESDTKLEMASFGTLRASLDPNISDSVFLSPRLNASLGGKKSRTATLEGHEIMHEIQQRRAQAESWDEYPHSKSRAQLVEKIRNRHE